MQRLVPTEKIRLYLYICSPKTKQVIRSFSFLILVLICFSGSAQIRLYPGDLLVLQVNANNNTCSGSPVDRVSFVCFRDITPGTTIDLTDNGWERSQAGRWGNAEGFIRMTRTTSTIPAGTIITLELPPVANTTYRAIAPDGDWTFSAQGSLNTINLNSGGDQLYFMQGGTWSQGTSSPGNFRHDATYTGRVLYGFNTKTQWNNRDDSQDSKLHPDVATCYHQEPTPNASDFVSYAGPFSAATQLEWISRVGNKANWQNFSTCADLPTLPARINIADSNLGIRCKTCRVCGTGAETIFWQLPSTNAPYILAYTDGIDTFRVNNVSNGDSLRVRLDETTTYSLVEVRDRNGCPVYSNFKTEARVVVSAGVSIQAIPPVRLCTAENPSTIDLSALENGLKGNDLSLQVRWFRDPVGRDSIGRPQNFRSSSTTVFAQTTDGICSSTLSQVSITLLPTPSLRLPSSTVACLGSCVDLPLEFAGKPPFNLSFVSQQGNNSSPGSLLATKKLDSLSVCPRESGRLRIQFGTLVDSNNCVTLINRSLDVNVLLSDTTRLRRTLCRGESLLVNGQSYDERRPRGVEILPGKAKSGCDSIIAVDLNFSDPPTGQFFGDTAICLGGTGRLRFNLQGGTRFDLGLTTGKDSVYLLNQTADAVIPVVTTTTLKITLFAIRLNGSNCENKVKGTATILVSNPSVSIKMADSTRKTAISCFGAADGALRALPINGKGPFTYRWNNVPGEQIQSNLGPGTYSVVATDSIGCTASSGAITLRQPDSLILNYTLDTAGCNGKKSALSLRAMGGGTPAYAYSIDGQDFQAIGRFPVNLVDLPTADFSLRVRDANNCTLQRRLRGGLGEKDLFLELGPDITIRAGDSAVIRPRYNFLPNTARWSGDQGLIVGDSLVYVEKPTINTVYELILRTASGCEVKDFIKVLVDRSFRVYAPNAFSPNGDDQNDRYTIFHANEVEKVEKLQIFNRWGEMVFEGQDLGNDPGKGWDGQHRGKLAPAGAYVFVAVLQLKSGKMETLRGELSLLR
jgi:gliding motility-associated-like protein